MQILIFEPHRGCKKVLLKKETPKINLGKTVRDGYEHIQLNSDFLPDYVGIIIYHEGKFYFRNYGKINIFVDNKRLEDSSVAMRLVHGSMIKIQYSENKNVYIGCIEGELDNKWKVFKPETNEVLDIQKDKKGYVIRNANDIIFHGRKINARYFLPKDGDIFMHDNRIFYSMKNNLYFDVLKNTNLQQKQIVINKQKQYQPQHPQPINKRRSAISMEHVTRYDKKKKWYRLKDVNLTISSGRLVAIMGVSGAGKSTLFDAILKRLKLDEGTIKIDGDELGHVFTTDSEVVKYGSQFIMFIVPLYFIYAMNQILSGVLRGAGKTFVPMLIGLVCMCGFRVGWLVVMMGIVKDVRIIYASYPLTWILTNIAMTAYYYKSSWIKKTTLEAVETV